MKNILFLLLLPLFSFATNIAEFGVYPGNDGATNTERLQTAIDAAKSGDVLDFYGVYDFAFTPSVNFVIIDKSLTFSGPCSFVFDNENPQFESGLFKIIGGGRITFSGVEFRGPQNPGPNKESNIKTYAIYGTGNFDLKLSNCSITGNFFTGVLATSAGKQSVFAENSTFEIYGDMALGVFGTGDDKYLNAVNCKFLRAGLAPSETNSGQDFGTHIYCHPNVTAKVSGCDFYDNHRNTIQFASGSALYNKKYPADGFHKTRYQVVENCYFDKTCADGVQFSFYYPNAVVTGCNFQNSGLAIQAENTTTVSNCYFLNNVNGVQFGGGATVIADKNIAININNCSFYNSTALSISNHIKGVKTVINSSGNTYKCIGNAILIGSKVAPDSQAIVFNSRDDIFTGNQNGCYFARYNTVANFENPTIDGIRFIFPDNTSNGATVTVNGGKYVGDGGALYASGWSSNKFKAYFNGLKMLSPNASKLISTPDGYGWRVSFARGVGDTIQAAQTIGAQINTNSDEYIVAGSTTIENIYPYGLNDASLGHDWRRYVDGKITLTAKDGFCLGQTGNLLISSSCGCVSQGRSIELKWSKQLNKWVN